MHSAACLALQISCATHGRPSWLPLAPATPAAQARARPFAFRTTAMCPTQAKGSRSVANSDSKSDSSTVGSNIPGWCYTSFCCEECPPILRIKREKHGKAVILGAMSMYGYVIYGHHIGSHYPVACSGSTSLRHLTSHQLAPKRRCHSPVQRGPWVSMPCLNRQHPAMEIPFQQGMGPTYADVTLSIAKNNGNP